MQRLLPFLLILITISARELPREYLLGSQESLAARSHLRYLILLPPGYDPSRSYELWVNLHGSPGCASHAVFQYRTESQQRNAILVAPEATENSGDHYLREDGKVGTYHLWDMPADVSHALEVIDDVLARFRIDRHRIYLLGFSAGCVMGWRLIAARPEQFGFLGGVANRFKHGRLPASEEALRRAGRHVPLFYAAGQDDGFAGPYFKSTSARLKELGFELRTVNPPGVGHALPESIKAPLMNFFDTVRARHQPPATSTGKTLDSRPSPRRVSRSIAALLSLWSGAAAACVAAILAVRRRSVRIEPTARQLK